MHCYYYLFINILLASATDHPGAMASWDLLDNEAEIELHKTRLLNVEEKPFKRITKRLSDVFEVVKSRPTQQPTPPAEGAATNGDHHAGADADASIQRQLDQLAEDLALDFAAFDSNITRLQFLFDANARERDRYAASREHIQGESEDVRGNNVQLRQQLDDARERLAQRKKFDELADRIARDKDARPRDETLATIVKLEDECRDLKVESQRYGETWKERRDQFRRIMEEGRLLRQLIRDDKEELERREGMNEDDGGGGAAAVEDGEVSRGGQTPRHIPSGNATPRPDEIGLNQLDGEAGTPRPVTQNGGRTPAREGEDGADGLKPRTEPYGSLSRGGSRAPSRNVSPNRSGVDDEIEEGEDVEMPDSALNTQNTPHITIDEPNGAEDKMEVDNN